MTKKVFLVAAAMLLASCAGKNEEYVHYCPNVHIVPENSRLTHMAGREVESKVELIGYEGYCRTDARGHSKAVVAPIFEVSRQNEISSEYVQFNYYTQTGDDRNDKFSQKTYSVSIKVPEVGKKLMHQGEYVEVIIPDYQPGYKIDMGLLLSQYQHRYNRTHGLR